MAKKVGAKQGSVTKKAKQPKPKIELDVAAVFSDLEDQLLAHLKQLGRGAMPQKSSGDTTQVAEAYTALEFVRALAEDSSTDTIQALVRRVINS